MTNLVNISTYPIADAQAISNAVATRIKAYRKTQKLSLDDLSQRTGVSKGMLVEIEKGAANPSIAILCKLAAALSMSVADIVNVAIEPVIHLIEAKDIPTLWAGNKGGTARLLAGTTGPNMIELWRWEMHPDECFESPGHPDGTFELFHVEKGQLTLSIAQTDLIVPAGCAAVASTDKPHRYANTGDCNLVFTMTVAEFHPA
ncbi:helix-turn-helix domain-containing protein [Craterilacuibacter sp. RT1T]|uniref:helix-turn-helix domain-containing protein n=1 Tax=Craterilacuibacter sp. RT1T TaxID=2942211 RepID=UPI0020BF57E8|nr:helix-turn-helix domain-containing protein [Craterilacuibacter sp. RT1T]MCL6264468.1 helix-turn-helix domain-containing protein [Craterilacuibacter sp. RT1T]